MTCSACFLIQPKTTFLGLSPSILIGPPTPIINQETFPETWLQANLMEILTQLRFPFPNDSGLKTEKRMPVTVWTAVSLKFPITLYLGKECLS